MKLLQQNITIFLVLLIVLIFTYLFDRLFLKYKNNFGLQQLLNEVQTLATKIKNSEQKLIKIQNDFFKESYRFGLQKNANDPIPVLTFVCNRADAIKFHLNNLIRLRHSAYEFPIVVSQDCDNKEVYKVIKDFIPQVQYIKYDNKDIQIPINHRRYATYYKIASHYKFGLSYVFDTLNYSSVIITEDDLDISEDFFEYFKATRNLLKEDKTLFCISAWNDNGKSNLIDRKANDLFYRSDFFPGLGWMMTRNLWLEFKDKWPPGFWDDWIREPEQRLNRSCIRPEVSRTSMTLFGKNGASKGLFFNRHLKKIILNQKTLNFNNIDIKYLLKQNYDESFFKKVYFSPSITMDAFQKGYMLSQNISNSLKPENKPFRIDYKTMDEFTVIATKLQIMSDTKAGVPRTAYHGIVSCFIAGIRLFIAPSNFTNWQGYDTWQSTNVRGE